MSKLILAIVAIVIIFVLVVGAYVVVRNDLRSSNSGQPITQSWVNQQLVNWKPSTITPMSFGAVLSTASYGNIFHNSPQVIAADLAMLESTGVNAIRIDINYDPWLKNNQSAISEMSSVVQSVRNDKLQLIIADAGAESYRNGGQIPWAQFQIAWVQRVKTLAALYHPDYYIVVKEPGWYVPMVSDARTNPSFRDPNEWLNLTQTLTITVHSVSPDTKVGVAVAADSLLNNPSLFIPYLSDLNSLSGVAFIGFDIYSITGFTETYNFISQHPEEGKSIWIAEAWTTSNTPPNTLVQKQLDATWIKMLYYFGESQINASMMIPFFTNAFSQYTSSTSISNPSFFDSRQPVYYAYQSIIKANAIGAQI